MKNIKKISLGKTSTILSKKLFFLKIYNFNDKNFYKKISSESIKNKKNYFLFNKNPVMEFYNSSLRDNSSEKNFEISSRYNNSEK